MVSNLVDGTQHEQLKRGAKSSIVEEDDTLIDIYCDNHNMGFKSNFTHQGGCEFMERKSRLNAILQYLSFPLTLSSDENWTVSFLFYRFLTKAFHYNQSSNASKGPIQGCCSS